MKEKAFFITLVFLGGNEAAFLEGGESPTFKLLEVCQELQLF